MAIILNFQETLSTAVPKSGYIDQDDTDNYDDIWIDDYNDDDNHDDYNDVVINDIALIPPPNLTAICIGDGGYCVSALSCPVISHEDAHSGPVGLCDGQSICCLDYEVVLVKAEVKEPTYWWQKKKKRNRDKKWRNHHKK